MIDYNSLSYDLKISFVCEWIQIVTASIGLVSNALTFGIYMRPRLRKYSFSFYIKALACTDSFVLLQDYPHWAAFVLNANLQLVAPFFCATGTYTTYAAAIASLCLLALISFDRLTTVMFSNRMRLLKNVYFQAGLVLAVIIYGLGSFVEMPFKYGILTFGAPNSTYTYEICLADSNLIKKMAWINLGNLIGINVLLNNTLNVVMIAFLYRTRRRQVNRASTSHSERRDRKFMLNSICLNLSSSLCKLPVCIVLIFTNLVQVSVDQIQMAFDVTLMFASLDASASFFVNMLVNSVFYDEFLVMFRLKGRRFSMSHSTNTNNPNPNLKKSMASF